MKISTSSLILTGIIVILAAGLIGVLIFMKNQPIADRGIQPLVEIAPMEPNSEQWGINFPNQWSTFQMTAANNNRTVFGGSNPFSKLEDDPRLVVLFAGMAFSKEYNEDRGHMHSLQDVREIDRVDETTPGTCYSCKSANNPSLWDKMGPTDFYKTKFFELGEQIDQPVGCANCHETGTMKLIVTNPALEEALKEQGKDWRTFTRQEMRSVVCANCHVEYYFAGEGKYLTFPWDNGTNIDQIIAYYNEIGFNDWTYPETETPMLKAQHPEYELYTQNSTHFNAGVACADCHMPYTRDGAAKFSTHNVQSPLLNAQAACGQCHTDVAFATGRVAIIQQQVRETMDAAQDALIDAIDAMKVAAASPNVNAELLNEARQLHRDAQMYWDFIAAENSMGFHNPSEALRALSKAIDLARQAQLKAIQAVNGSAALQGQ